MAQNKKAEFSNKENELADFANAISHPARVAILKAIAKHGTCICGEIVEIIPLAQSTVSQHLKELLKANLINGTIDGTKSCYCINWVTFEQFEFNFTEFLTKTNSKNPGPTGKSFGRTKCC